MTPADRAQLALLLEVAGTPKPGNVDRRREYPDLRFEHFLAGAVGARAGLADAGAGEPLGPSFERAVAGMAAAQTAGNTQFGACLVLVPLLGAVAAGDLSADGVDAVVEATTVDDARAFFRAFEHVDVAVADPPAEHAALDVRRGAAAGDAAAERGLTLADVMALSAERDGVAREWTSGFERTFGAARRLEALDGPVGDRAARVFLELLADAPDTFVAVRHDAAAAERATERARAALAGEVDPARLADEFVEAGVNPGTTADLVAGALFVALERGLAV